jgi:hypothetical protein
LLKTPVFSRSCNPSFPNIQPQTLGCKAKPQHSLPHLALLSVQEGCSSLSNQASVVQEEQAGQEVMGREERAHKVALAEGDEAVGYTLVI